MQDDFVSTSCYIMIIKIINKIWIKSCWNAIQRQAWSLTFICIAKMASCQVTFIICLAQHVKCALNMRDKFGFQRTWGSGDTKQRGVWTLIVIRILKMILYQLDLSKNIRSKGLNFDLNLHLQDGLISTSECDWLITLHMHTKVKHN